MNLALIQNQTDGAVAHVSTIQNGKRPPRFSILLNCRGIYGHLGVCCPEIKLCIGHSAFVVWRQPVMLARSGPYTRHATVLYD